MVTATAPSIPKDVIEAYRKFPLSTVWHFGKEAGLNCATGVARPSKREWKICGPAVTIRLIPIQDTRKYNDNTDLLDPKLVKNLIPGQWRRGEKPKA